MNVKHEYGKSKDRDGGMERRRRRGESAGFESEKQTFLTWCLSNLITEL